VALRAMTYVPRDALLVKRSEGVGLDVGRVRGEATDLHEDKLKFNFNVTTCIVVKQVAQAARLQRRGPHGKIWFASEL